MISKTNNFVFIVLHVVAWVIFVGLSIEAGGLLVNFIISVFRPEMLGRLYQKLDLSQLYAQNKWTFYGMYGCALAISILKAILFYMLIQLLMKLDLDKPFNHFVKNKILQISYFTFEIGIFSFTAREVAKILSHHGYETEKICHFWVDSQAFIVMAAVIYTIGQIFKRGVEIQEDNDLTV
jgi:uncharacterized protein (DUF2062 family)